MIRRRHAPREARRPVAACDLAQTTLPGRTTTSSVIGSTSVSNVTDSGAGSACSTASMRSRSVVSSRSWASIRLHAHRQEPRLEPADRGFDLQPQFLAPARIAECARREIGDAIADRRGRKLRHVRRPRTPAPPGIEQCLEIAPHRVAQRRHRIGGRYRRVALLVRRVVDQAIQQRRLDARDLPIAWAGATAHATSNRKLPRSIIGTASSPTMNRRWPTPRTGPPSAWRQSVSRPRRSASVSGSSAT